MCKDEKALKNFLRKHRILNRYRRNCLSITGGVPLHEINTHSVGAGFIWHLSPEGRDYWLKYDRLYRQESIGV